MRPIYDLIYALRGVSLTVEEGTVTAILGNNGAGKSTILKTVMGLMEDQPDKGTIEFMGKRIDGKERKKSSGWGYRMCRKDGRSLKS